METEKKAKPLTYEQIRDIVLDKKEDVKHIPTKSLPKKVIAEQKPIKKNHNFQFV